MASAGDRPYLQLRRAIAGSFSWGLLTLSMSPDDHLTGNTVSLWTETWK